MSFQIVPFSCRCVFKSIHFGLRIQMFAFSLSSSVWTGGENATISLRFQMKAYSCITPLSRELYTQAISKIEGWDNITKYEMAWVKQEALNFKIARVHNPLDEKCKHGLKFCVCIFCAYKLKKCLKSINWKSLYTFVLLTTSNYVFSSQIRLVFSISITEISRNLSMKMPSNAPCNSTECSAI